MERVVALSSGEASRVSMSKVQQKKDVAWFLQHDLVFLPDFLESELRMRRRVICEQLTGRTKLIQDIFASPTSWVFIRAPESPSALR